MKIVKLLWFRRFSSNTEYCVTVLGDMTSTRSPPGDFSTGLQVFHISGCFYALEDQCHLSIHGPSGFSILTLEFHDEPRKST